MKFANANFISIATGVQEEERVHVYSGSVVQSVGACNESGDKTQTCCSPQKAVLNGVNRVHPYVSRWLESPTQFWFSRRTEIT